MRAIATLTLSIGLLGLGSPSAQAVPSFWYPSGIQANVAASTITSNGWTLCWSGTYADSALLADVLAACDQPYIMLAGGVTGSSSYMLMAAGERSSVFATTPQNGTTYNNGTYFYYNNSSMGFAPNSTISQNSADTRDSSLDNHADGSTTGAYRMSWHSNGGYINGGWRVGLADGVGAAYSRAIYESNGVASPSFTTQPQTQSKIAGENVTFTVAATSPDGGTISYQWQKYVGATWTDISGATDTSYSINGLLVTDAGSFRTNVTNAWGGRSTTVASSTALLSVSKMTPTAITVSTTSGTYATPLSMASTGGASNTSATVYTVTTAGTAGCSITGNSLTSTAAGTCGVTATKATDATYLAATSGEVTITLAKAAQATLSLPSDTGTYGTALTLLASGGSGSGSLSYSVTDAGTAGCSITGSALSSIRAGSCTASATRATDSGYLATTSSAATFTILKAAQSSLSIVTTLGVYGAALTLGTSGGTGTGGLTYSVTDSGTAQCAESSGVLTPAHAGACTVIATKATDSAYTAKSSIATTITFVKAAQSSITISTTSGIYGTPLTLATTGGSGTGTLLFAVTDGGTANCLVSGNVLSVTHAGTCQVTAVKTADGNYEASSDVAMITFAKAVQSPLTITSTNGTFLETLTLTTSGGSGNGIVTYTLDGTGTASCSLSNGILTPGHAGTCTVTARKATDTDYLAESSSVTTVTFAKATQGTLTVTSTAGTYLETLTLATSGGSGSGVVTYALDGSGTASCSLSSGVLTSGHAGTCTVTATKAGDSDFLVKSSSSSMITFAKAGQSSLIIAIATGTYLETLTLTTSGGSGAGVMTYALNSAGTANCVLNNGVLTPGHAGTCTVTATKATDADYLVISTSVTTVTFAKAEQNSLIIATTTGTHLETLTLGTSGGSGIGAITYALDSAGTASCSLRSGVLTPGHAGTCTVTATKATDPDYLSRNTASTTITFAKAAQGTLTITSINGTFLQTLTLATTGGSGSGAITYAMNSAGTASCTLSSGVLTPGHAGTCTVTATKATDTDYLASSTASTTITFAKAAQGTLTITSVSSTFLETLSLSTSGGSGSGTVTYALGSAGTASCSLSNGVLTPGHAGTCTVTATKATDTDYLVVSSTSTTITIAKAAQQALSVTNTSAIPGIALTLTSSGGSGNGAVNYLVANAGATGCSITTGALDSTGPGTCTIYATKASDNDYLSSQSADVGIIVSKLTQAAVVITSTNSTYLETLTLTTSGGSGTGAVTYVVTAAGSAGCTLSNGVLSFAGAGTCSVTATKATDAYYLERSSAGTTITAAKATQVALVAIGGAVTVLDPLTLHISGGSGNGAVTYRVTTGGHCTISGDVLRSSKALSCTVVATKAEDANYLEASSAPLIVDPSLRLVVIRAPKVDIDLGKPINLAAAQLGLVGNDHLGGITWQFEGTTVRGDHYGPTATMPTQAGDYLVRIAAFTLRANNPDIYIVETRVGSLVIHWVPLPISDPALAGVPEGSQRPTPIEPGTGSVQYDATGASITADHWSLIVNGAPANLDRGYLIVGADVHVTVLGTGFGPLTAVRVFVISTTAELGSVWTDAVGNFSLDVTLPNTLASGEHVLQINGYNAAGAVRTSNVAMQAVASRSMVVAVGFHGVSAQAPAAASHALTKALARVPINARSVRLVVTATTLRGSKASLTLAGKRAMSCALLLAKQLKARGIDVGFTTKIRSAKHSSAKVLRRVTTSIRW